MLSHLPVVSSRRLRQRRLLTCTALLVLGLTLSERFLPPLSGPAIAAEVLVSPGDQDPREEGGGDE